MMTLSWNKPGFSFMYIGFTCGINDYTSEKINFARYFFFLTNREDTKYTKKELTKKELRREDDAFDTLFEDRNFEVDEKGEGIVSHF